MASDAKDSRPLIRTPAFLVWAVERRCKLREIAGSQDPERTERHLRALRAYSDAAAEGCVLEGIVARPPLGFRVDDALSLYGGLAAAEAACRGCAANARERRFPQSLAGCFGMTPLPEDEAAFYSAVENAIEQSGQRQKLREHFPKTAPAWYGLWMRSPLGGEQGRIVAALLANVSVDDAACRAALDDLILGLATAAEHSLPFHVLLYPRGKVQGAWWTLDSHCQVCKGPWPDTQREACAACGYVGRPASSPKRRARGSRPFWPLERMLGKEQAAKFLVRYQAHPREARRDSQRPE